MSFRNGVVYYVTRVPLDLAGYYSVESLSFSLRTKFNKSAVLASALRLTNIFDHLPFIIRCDITFFHFFVGRMKVIFIFITK